jgi:hypothetical protein
MTFVSLSATFLESIWTSVRSLRTFTYAMPYSCLGLVLVLAMAVPRSAAQATIYVTTTTPGNTSGLPGGLLLARGGDLFREFRQ